MSTVEAIQSQYILRRCSVCSEINRVLLDLTLHARCGHCGQHLRLSHYDILGLVETADERDIKHAYRVRVQSWHPDKRPGDGLANQRFQTIVSAYHTLYNPRERQIYDRTTLPELHLTFVSLSLQEQTDSKHAEQNRNAMRQDKSAATDSAQNVQTSPQAKSADETLDVTMKSIVEFLSTTVVMLAGVFLWILTGPHDSGGAPNFLLWFALFIGALGLGRFLFSLT